MDLKYMMKKTTMDIDKISDYIIKKYPDCCLAYNIKNHNYYKEELIEACEDFFYYEKLHWCGCGDPEAAKKTIRDFLRILYDHTKRARNDEYRKCKWGEPDSKNKNFQKRFGVKSVYDNEFFLCFAYAMDAAEFTEHGSSIGGAWITEEGEMFLWLLNQNDELDND